MKRSARPRAASAGHRAARPQKPRRVTARILAKHPPGGDAISREPGQLDWQHSEELYQKVIESSRDGIFLVDPETKTIVESNSAFEEMIGYDRAELRGMPIYNFIDHDPASIDRNVERTITDGHHVIGERLYRKKDGEKIEIEATASVVTDNGRPIICSIVREVSKRNQAFRDLARSEERFRLVSIATNDAVWDWDLETDRIWWSDGVRTLFGYEPHEVRSDPAWWYERIFPADREAVVGGFHDLVASGGATWSDEYRFRRRDGTYACAYDRGYVIHDSARRPIRVIGAMMDVTARVRAEETLRQVSRRHELIVSSAAEGIVELDRFGRIAFSNAAASRVVGWTNDDLTGHFFHRLIHHSNLDGTAYGEEDCPMISSIQSGTIRRIRGEVFWKKNGQPVPVEYITSPIREGRDIVGAVVSFREITEEICAQESLRLSEAKNAALLSAIPDLMFQVSRDGTFLDHKAPRNSDLFTRPEEFLGRQIRDVLPPAIANQAMACVARALESGGIHTFEYQIVIGRARTFEARVVGCTASEALIICREIEPARPSRASSKGRGTKLHR